MVWCRRFPRVQMGGVLRKWSLPLVATPKRPPSRKVVSMLPIRLLLLLLLLLLHLFPHENLSTPLRQRQPAFWQHCPQLNRQNQNRRRRHRHRHPHRRRRQQSSRQPMSQLLSKQFLHLSTRQQQSSRPRCRQALNQQLHPRHQSQHLLRALSQQRRPHQSQYQHLLLLLCLKLNLHPALLSLLLFPLSPSPNRLPQSKHPRRRSQ